MPNEFLWLDSWRYEERILIFGDYDMIAVFKSSAFILCLQKNVLSYRQKIISYNPFRECILGIDPACWFAI